MVLTWDAFIVWGLFLVFITLVGIGIGVKHFLANSTSDPNEVYRDYWLEEEEQAQNQNPGNTSDSS